MAAAYAVARSAHFGRENPGEPGECVVSSEHRGALRTIRWPGVEGFYCAPIGVGAVLAGSRDELSSEGTVPVRYSVQRGERVVETPRPAKERPMQREHSPPAGAHRVHSGV